MGRGLATAAATGGNLEGDDNSLYSLEASSGLGTSPCPDADPSPCPDADPSPCPDADPGPSPCPDAVPCPCL